MVSIKKIKPRKVVDFPVEGTVIAGYDFHGNRQDYSRLVSIFLNELGKNESTYLLLGGDLIHGGISAYDYFANLFSKTKFRGDKESVEKIGNKIKQTLDSIKSIERNDPEQPDYLDIKDEIEAELYETVPESFIKSPEVQEFLDSYYPDKSTEIMDDLICLKGKYKNKIVALMGNHEWSHIGGIPCAKNFGFGNIRIEVKQTKNFEEQAGNRLARYKDFFRDLPLIARAPPGILFSHTGPSTYLLEDIKSIDLDNIKPPLLMVGEFEIQDVRKNKIIVDIEGEKTPVYVKDIEEYDFEIGEHICLSIPASIKQHPVYQLLWTREEWLKYGKNMGKIENSFLKNISDNNIQINVAVYGHTPVTSVPKYGGRIEQQIGLIGNRQVVVSTSFGALQKTYLKIDLSGEHKNPDDLIRGREIMPLY